jgi:alpha-galactosidase
MKIVIIGAGSVAFTPAILSGFSADKRRYTGATIGLVDVNEEPLDLILAFARRVSKEFDLDWKIVASTDRRTVLGGADAVTTSVGVGGIPAWQVDLDVPFKHGIVQPVGDTSGPGGLARALRHIPVHVQIARDMEDLCPAATLYNFTNPLTVMTQAITKLSNIRCMGLCIGPDLTWNHLCRVCGVEKETTSAVIAGINHCHWVVDFRIKGQDAFPMLRAILDQDTERSQWKFGSQIARPQETVKQPLCIRLFRHFGAYPGPGDGHVGEFFPQLMRPLIENVEEFQGEAIKYVYRSYPVLWQKMEDIGKKGAPIDTEAFAKELAWDHTQFLDILESQQDNLGRVQYVNIPNRGFIHNLPEDMVVEVPATVDAAGLHPFALGDLPDTIIPMMAHKLASLNLIIEAAMEGSREKAVQAFLNDPHCTDIEKGIRMVNELIDGELEYLPNFKPKAAATGA